MEKLLIITGTYPPEVCGVGDYTYNLMQTKIAEDWKLYTSDNWRIGNFFKKLIEINNFDIENINLQYPTLGYNGSLLPHLLCIYYSVFTKKKFSVTIHEYTQSTVKAKLATLIFFIFSEKIIFTNSFELRQAAKILPSLRKRSRIIKIYSNIESANNVKTIEDRQFDLVYFGLVRPQKGLESFVSILKDIKDVNPTIRIILVGKTLPEFKKYSEELINQAKPYLSEIYFNKNEIEVANILANTKIAYLPFPDGISERRGSALAVLKNGGLIVTTQGKFTIKDFDSCCFYVDNSKEAVAKIQNLLASTNEFYYEKQKDITMFLKNSLPESWENVTIKYNDFLCQ